MLPGLKKLYIIKTKNSDEEFRVMDSIHCQLRGNDDYIQSNIILNDSSTRNDGTQNEVRVYIFDECSEVPEITLK